MKLTDPTAGDPVTAAVAAADDVVAVTIAPMSEALVRAAAADCRAESLVRTAVQALTYMRSHGHQLIPQQLTVEAIRQVARDEPPRAS